MRKSKIHYGWETTYPESNEPYEWYVICGIEAAQSLSERWDRVTCKRCLARLRAAEKAEARS